MSKKVISASILAALNLQSLLSPIPAQAQDETITMNVNRPNLPDHGRTFAKMLIGFDPRQATQTLTLLKQVGIDRFETDGSVFVPQEQVASIMASAQSDGLELRILPSLKGDDIKVRFQAIKGVTRDSNDLTLVRDLARHFQMKCDSGGNVLN